MGICEPPLPALLQRFPAFRTADVEEFKAGLASKFGVTRAAVDGAGNFAARASVIQLQDIGLVVGASNTGVSIDFPESERIRLLVALAGQGEVTAGRRSVALDQHQACVVSPRQAERCDARGAHAWLTLRIDPEGLERKLISLLGVQPKGQLEFAPATNRDDHNVQNLLRLVMFFAEQLETTRGELPPLLLRELEQAIMVAFLHATRHPFSALLDRPGEAPPDRVRRAEEYIEANWNSPISIEDLAAVTGVGARSLYRAFVKARGYSPMRFARLVRLRHAKELLGADHPATSVTAVALQCGFENIGHFANHYKKMFGELPSATLARARRFKSG